MAEDLFDGDPDNICGRYILDETGEPVPEPDLLNWASWMEYSNRRVARDVLAHGHVVSTVFLGLDHGFGGLFGDRAPILFETMCFNDYGSIDEDWASARYATRTQALAGHQRALTALKAHLAKVQPPATVRPNSGTST